MGCVYNSSPLSGKFLRNDFNNKIPDLHFLPNNKGSLKMKYHLKAEEE